MSSGSTALITTIFKCPSMKPCGPALMDAGPASIRKMQAAATKLGIDDIRTKDQADSTIPPHFQRPSLEAKRAATAALFPDSTSGCYGAGAPRGNCHMPFECVAA